MDHYPTKIGDMQPREAATAASKLEYASLGAFLEGLSNQLAKDSQADEKGGRPKLAALLQEAGELIAQAGRTIREASDLKDKNARKP